MSNKLFLDSDWALTAKLPDWAIELLDRYPIPCCQAAQWWGIPTPLVTKPETIEIYINGDDQPALVWAYDRVVVGDLTRLCDEYHAIAIEVDSMIRYVEIEGKELLDTTDGIIWPEVFASPAAQVQMLVALAQPE